MSDPVRNGGKHPFEYHKPTAAQVAAMQVCNESFRRAYDAIMQFAPSNRERSLAVTKLQETRMWLNASIVLSEE